MTHGTIKLDSGSAIGAYANVQPGVRVGEGASINGLTLAMKTEEQVTVRVEAHNECDLL